MSDLTPQKGLTLFEGIVMVASIGLLVLLSFITYGHTQPIRTTASSVQTTESLPQTPTITVANLPEINTAADLDKATAALDSIKPAAATENDIKLLDAYSADF